MECPKCKQETMEQNEEWNKLFEKYDYNTPSFPLIYNKIYNEGVYFRKCLNSDCDYIEERAN